MESDHANGKCKKAGQPKGRLAHEGHKSKTGTSWKAKEALVCLLSWHDTKTDHPYFTSSGKAEKLNNGPMACKMCHEVIRYDSRGYAFCQCKIYNDGNSTSSHYKIDRDFLKAIKFSAVPGAV